MRSDGAGERGARTDGGQGVLGLVDVAMHAW